MTDLPDPSSSFRLTAAEDVIHASVGEEMVLLNVTTSVYFALNEVAARAWQLWTEGLDARQVAAQLAREFDASEAQIAVDLEELAARLVELGLVRCLSVRSA